MKLALLKIFLLFALCLLALPSGIVHADSTTSVHIVKYASDGATVVNETTVTYQWMQANLLVQGDGVTHYYMQGPTLDPNNLWDPNETVNLKDKGAVMGTDIKDLCNLVGGMAANDTVVIQAVDGYNISFNYQNVYQPQDRQGPIVLCWYSVQNGSLGQHQESGYPPQYFDAMQIVFMPKTTNSQGQYVFGDYDMEQCLPKEAQHFYNSSKLYPSTDGLSVKWVNEITIYPQGAPVNSQSTPKTSSTSIGHELPWIIVGSVVIIAIGIFIIIRIVRRKRGPQVK